MKPTIKHQFEFHGINSKIAKVLESKLSALIGETIQKIEPNIAALNSLAEQGMLDHVNVDALISDAIDGIDQSKDSPEPVAVKAQPVKKAKKVAKKNPALEKVVEKYRMVDGRMVRSPGVAGKPPLEFAKNIMKFMKSGDDDSTLIKKHNASKGLVDRLRKEYGASAKKSPAKKVTQAPKKKAHPEEAKAVGLIKEGKNLVEVSQLTNLTLPELNRLSKKHGL